MISISTVIVDSKMYQHEEDEIPELGVWECGFFVGCCFSGAIRDIGPLRWQSQNRMMDSGMFACKPPSALPKRDPTCPPLQSRHHFWQLTFDLLQPTLCAKYMSCIYSYLSCTPYLCHPAHCTLPKLSPTSGRLITEPNKPLVKAAIAFVRRLENRKRVDLFIAPGP